MHSLDCDVKSSVEGIVWPAMPSPAGAAMLAMQFQLAQTQWLPPAELQAYQFRQLELVLAHAFKTVPWYKEKFRDLRLQDLLPLTLEKWQTLPILIRENIQDGSHTLLSQDIPKEHGKVTSLQTSGSTGRPITAYKPEIEQFFLNAFTLRDHFWHRRSLAEKFVAIRSEGDLAPGKSIDITSWGAATSAFHTGPSALMSVRTDISEQAQWLLKERPVYLLSFPSNILALTKYFHDKGLQLPSLKEIRTYGEVATPEVRAACKKVWGVPVRDMYSSQEVGFVALQCPEVEHYHVNAENIFVEVLDENLQPCCPGIAGQVVVTPLHNFCMPLIRYALGDYAEVGEPCGCGRGLPVLKSILGRQRNMLTLPDGSRHWPSFPAEAWANIAPIRQIQLVQTDIQSIKANIVTTRPLSPGEEKGFIQALQSRFGYPFDISLNYVYEIDRAKSGKYEDFMSMVP